MFFVVVVVSHVIGDIESDKPVYLHLYENKTLYFIFLVKRRNQNELVIKICTIFEFSGIDYEDLSINTKCDQLVFLHLKKLSRR